MLFFMATLKSIEIDFSQGREPLEYDPQLFYEVIREFIEQDAEDGE